MRLSGWGRYPTANAELLAPASQGMLGRWLRNGLPGPGIARGQGRSYGDSALAETVLSSRHLDHFLGLDEEQGVLHCSAGVTLAEILQLIVPRGLFLPVMPGSRFVSLGGAVAADIHGKNHHQDGCFSDHVKSLTLMLASGEIRQCSREQNSELFTATCGGMGLTGVILEVRLSLMRVPGAFINSKTLPAKNLDQSLELLDEHRDARYSVAWVDCLASGEASGRGIVYLGDHAEQSPRGKPASIARKPRLSMPFSTPGWLLNRYSMRSFNSLYFQRQSRQPAQSLVHYQRYFFPLDSIGKWNLLYGRRGFQQYQLVLPHESARAGIAEVLRRVAKAGKGSFLAVLKQFGEANNMPLSFPRAGLTLTLDFKMEATLPGLLDELDAIVLDHGGRLYLAKDARMSEAMFKTGYPEWEKFMAVRREVDPEGRFSSLQSRRLGLDPVASQTSANTSPGTGT